MLKGLLCPIILIIEDVMGAYTACLKAKYMINPILVHPILLMIVIDMEIFTRNVDSAHPQMALLPNFCVGLRF
jgi:hypothetical protein